MTRCAGRGWDFCDSCTNREIDYECEDCEDGDNYDPEDTSEELSIHELIQLTREAA